MPTRPPRAQPFRPLPAVQRQSAHARGYGRRWEKIAKAFLAEHPICENPFGDHGAVVVPSEHVDHVVPRSRGGTDDVANLSAICARCHSKKTCLYDGGFGHAKKECHTSGTAGSNSRAVLASPHSQCNVSVTKMPLVRHDVSYVASLGNSLKQGINTRLDSAIPMTGRWHYFGTISSADQIATRRTFSRVLV
ncbi:MAG: HNH endonuclease [Planctomycetes bacterium]|nr:HNH endonuclease [Planctomycetota bacterium]